MKNLKRNVWLLISMTTALTFLSGCHRSPSVSEKQASIEQSAQAQQSSLHQQAHKQKIAMQQYENQLRKQLSAIPYKQGAPLVVMVNQSHASLNIKNWQSNAIIYPPLDRMNRINQITTAYLDHHNYLANPQVVEHTQKLVGYHPKMHLVPTTLISPQITHNLNQQGQPQDNAPLILDRHNTIVLTTDAQQQFNQYEQKIINALKQPKSKVSLQVMPIYQGNDLLAKGVWMQAVSNNGLNFNVYIHNVQQGVTYNYQTGTIQH